MSIMVAQDLLNLSLFTIPANSDDPIAAEFLLLENQAALKRLRAELQVVDEQVADSDSPHLLPGRSIVDEDRANGGARVPPTTGTLAEVNANDTGSGTSSDTHNQMSAVV